MLCGQQDDNLRRVEAAFDVKVSARGGDFRIEGAPAQAALAKRLLSELAELITRGRRIRQRDLRTAIRVLQ